MNNNEEELNLEIEKMFAEATPLNERELEAFGEKNREIMGRPSFKAGVLKDQFVHAVLEAIEAEGISQSELAKRCGKSRQALSKQLNTEKPGNFTIDTIVELMHHLGRRVELYYPLQSQKTLVFPYSIEKPVPNVWKHPEKKISPVVKSFERSMHLSPQQNTHHEYSAA